MASSMAEIAALPEHVKLDFGDKLDLIYKEVKRQGEVQAEEMRKQTELIRQTAYGEVEADKPVHVRIAQAKTQYCRYLVMIQQFQTEKLEMKAVAAQKKADEKAEAAQQKMDEKAIKESRKAQAEADTAMRAAAKQADKTRATENRVASHRIPAKPVKKVKKEKAKKKTPLTCIPSDSFV